MHARRRFDPTQNSVAAARRFAAGVLGDAGRPALVWAMTLVVSELATNAVRHAGTSYVVDVHVDGEVSVGVSDDDPRRPGPAALPGVHARGGRGLAIVDQVCVAWGVEASPPGKRVWCVLAES